MSAWECGECGGEDFQFGKLNGDRGRVRFSLFRKANVQCSVCLSCGHIFTFVVDADLERIRKWKAQAPAA